MTKVFIHNLRLMAQIGYRPHEKHAPQAVVISIDVSVPDRPVRDGVIEDVVNYEDLREIAQNCVTVGHIDFVETLADQIAQACLKLKNIQDVRVRVEKPDIFTDVESAGVEIVRVRQ